MSAVPEPQLAGLPAATSCVGSASHNPRPLRYVWHHVQPQEAGGITVAANLVQLCDSCHYTVHRILFAMRQQAMALNLTLAQLDSLDRPPRRAQYDLAARGLAACRAAGTVSLIPNEG